jgi:hypothetical protein
MIALLPSGLNPPKTEDPSSPPATGPEEALSVRAKVISEGIVIAAIGVVRGERGIVCTIALLPSGLSPPT